MAKGSPETFSESQSIWLINHLTDLRDNNSKFRDLNVKLGEEGILRCERRSQETRSSILLNDVIFYIEKTETLRKRLPKSYSSKAVVHRRFWNKYFQKFSKTNKQTNKQTKTSATVSFW